MRGRPGRDGLDVVAKPIGCASFAASYGRRAKSPRRIIPGRRNRKRIIRYDEQRYRSRHLIENAFCRLKDFWRIHTRYDKLATNLLSAVALATALAFWL